MAPINDAETAPSCPNVAQTCYKIVPRWLQDGPRYLIAAYKVPYTSSMGKML